MISKKDLTPKYVKITNYEFGDYFNNNKRRIKWIYNGVGRLEEIGNESSFVEIADGHFIWIENKYLEWENNITEINVVETEVEINPDGNN